ncbi:unnamed protein product [Cyclocybe aegerita]|uniref:Uncharacterized protein n=1 Tax=Cyclocybe aegerita TaxID=1973307 RepID=A0A8S0VXN1_CYCAE|nr:unnamed protein product [Cyclocybe aegerita]
MSDSTTTSTTTSETTTVSTSSTESTSSTSSSTSESSTSSSSSSSESSSSSSSETTTIPPTTTTTTTPPTTTSPPTSPPTTTTGGILTATSTLFVSDTRSVEPTTTSDSSGGSKSFFDNTGAVAGVFSVVGLITLALLIALITNGIRRRRAKKFDRELAEATREAAAAPAPIFLDDDDDDRYGPGGYGSGGTQGLDRGFSDVSSHGTYAQPAMSAGSHEAYGMREMGYGPTGHGVGVGEVYDPYGNAAAAGPAGAAGIGVARARSMRSDGGYAAGLQEGSTPYAAFAAPTAPPPVPLIPGQEYGRGANPSNNLAANLELLEAAGMGAHVAGAGSLARNQSQYNSQYQSGYGQQNLHQRSPSQPQDHDPQVQPRSQSPPSASTAGTQYYSPRADSYSSHYSGATAAAGGAGAYQAIGDPAQYPGPPQGQYQQGPQGQYYNNSGAAANRYSAADDMEDAYGGYEAGPSDSAQTTTAMPPSYASGPTQPAPKEKEAWKRQSGLPNPFGDTSSHGHGDDARRDSGEEPKRVLKVANE